VFWASTPRQLQMHFDAAVQRARREHQGRAWLAWHVAALYRAKTLPKPESLMGTERKRRAPQPWQEQRNVARMLTVLFGGTIEGASDGG
jgi:hypothetical protein